MSDDMTNGREPALGGKNSLAPSLSMDRLLPGLREALESKDRKERLKTIKGLRTSGAEQVAPMLIELLNTATDLATRQRCIAMLGQIGDVRAVAPLVKLLDDPDTNLRKLVAWALGDIRSPLATGPLLTLLHHEKEYKLVSVVVASLGQIGDMAAVPALLSLRDGTDMDTLRNIAAQALRLIGRRCDLACLLAAMNTENVAVRKWAEERVMNTREAPQALHVDALETLLSYPHRKDIPLRAVHLLSRIDSPRANRLLLETLSHPDDSTRESAYKAVENERIENAIDVLLKRSVIETDAKLHYVYYAIGALSDPRVVPHLLEQLEAGASTWSIAAGLGRLERPDLPDILLERLNASEGWPRRQYLKVLRDYNSARVVATLIDIAHYGKDEAERIEAIEAIDFEAFPEAIPEILELFGVEPIERVRNTIVSNIADKNLISDAEAEFRAVLAATNDDRVAVPIVRALVFQVADGPMLFERYLKLVKDEEMLCILIELVDGLREYVDMGWLQGLFRTAKTPALRKRVIYALSDVARLESIPLFIDALHNDPSPDVRGAAGHTLIWDCLFWQDEFPMTEDLVSALDDEGEISIFFCQPVVRVCDMFRDALRNQYSPREGRHILATWLSRKRRLRTAPG